MKPFSNIAHILRRHAYLADFLALAGMLLYAWLVWDVAHRQLSVLDEGLYLYKGWLFTTGQYTPFEAYGPWMNQMPLSYFIPGMAEQLFGPGLVTGRLYAFGVACLSILGWWLTARRLGNRWLAAGLVWAMAFNPAAIRMVGLAASQGLVACLLGWAFFFGLGANRKNGELLIAGALAGAIVMVRVNLVLLLPLLALYALWQHWNPLTPQLKRWQPAAWLLAGELLVFGGLHLYYWPQIITLWARWLPLPFWQPWFAPEATLVWNPDNPTGFRVASFFLAYRYHFAALFGMLVALVLWPKQDFPQRKTAAFLSAFLVICVLLHAWASLGKDYCVFCFPTYTTFYSNAGLLLAAIILPFINWDPPAWRKWLASLGTLTLFGGMAYSAEGTLEDLLGKSFYRRVLSSPIPGWDAQLWQIIANRFTLEFDQVYELARAWLPVLMALALGMVILSLPVFFLGRRKRVGIAFSLVFIILLGAVLSPTPLLAGEYQSYDCPANVLPGYEKAGAELAKLVPPDSRIYWAGYSPTILLYLPGIQIYPPQLHGIYTFHLAEDSDALYRYGWWNQQLAEKWLTEADVVLVEARNLDDKNWLTAQLSNFTLMGKTGPQSCLENSAIWVYRRK